MTKFKILDSGLPHEKFASGMERDTPEGKTDYTLVLDGPMFERWAEHLTTGAKKYAARNWMQANSIKELERFRESALRHFIQWFRGDGDEDHAAAVFFNINGAEYVTSHRPLVPYGGCGGGPIPLDKLPTLEWANPPVQYDNTAGKTVVQCGELRGSPELLLEFLQWAEDHGMTNV